VFLCGHGRYADYVLWVSFGLGRQCQQVGIIAAEQWLAASFLSDQGLILLFRTR
jgi:hypothetical protein